jgi:hypothetical protein
VALAPLRALSQRVARPAAERFVLIRCRLRVWRFPVDVASQTGDGDGGDGNYLHVAHLGRHVARAVAPAHHAHQGGAKVKHSRTYARFSRYYSG